MDRASAILFATALHEREQFASRGFRWTCGSTLAPLDVVLEMAGCFRPIDTVGWLDGRRMTFALSR